MVAMVKEMIETVKENSGLTVPKEVVIQPRALSGTIDVPSSKSMSHRHLICAALAEGVSKLERLQDSDDVRATTRAVEALGAKVRREGENLIVIGMGINGLTLGQKLGRKITMNCGESGSTLRFLIPIAMLLEGEKVFEGEGRLPERPLNVYLENFDRMGISYEYSGKLPFKTTNVLPSGTYRIRGNESSQYLSGLLMALPLLSEDSTIEIVGNMESKDYVALTLQAMEAHGVVVHLVSENVYHVPGGQKYQPLDTKIEGDYSQAAFHIVAGLLSRGQQHLKLRHLNPCSMQADRRIIDIVRDMGGQVGFNRGVLVVKASTTHGTIIDASQCPDIIPVLGVLAAASVGRTDIVNGQRLRIKESDRIKTTVDLIGRLGGVVTETEDGLIIEGSGLGEGHIGHEKGLKPLKGGMVVSHNDHRIAMAAAAATPACGGPVLISGAEAVKKSYPHFYEDLKKLGGQWQESGIGNLRQTVDLIDLKMVELIEERLKAVKAIGETKSTLGLEVKDPAREKMLLHRLREVVKEKGNWPVVEAVYEQVLKTSRDVQSQSQPRYAYFGAEGSYTHGAMLAYLQKKPSIMIGHKTFQGVVEAVVNKRADYGFLPIENSTTGSITQVYDLIGRGDIEIVGEVTSAIEHYLLAPKGLKLEQVEKVYSHPQALSQCKLYLNKHKWRRHEVSSSAQGAALVAKQSHKAHAAIGSLYAASQYNLEVLGGPLNDYGPNQTRFIVFARRGENDLSHCDRMAVRLQIPHICGQLYHILEVFYKNQLNLLKIESRPIGNKPFEYEFFIDFEGGYGSSEIKKAMKELEKLSTDLQILGAWKKSEASEAVACGE